MRAADRARSFVYIGPRWAIFYFPISGILFQKGCMRMIIIIVCSILFILLLKYFFNLNNDISFLYVENKELNEKLRKANLKISKSKDESEIIINLKKQIASLESQRELLSSENMKLHATVNMLNSTIDRMEVYNADLLEKLNANTSQQNVQKEKQLIFDNRIEEYKQKLHFDLEKLLSGKTVAFPYISSLISDYLLIDLERLKEISEKSSPSIFNYPIRIEELRAQTSTLLRSAKLYEYQLKYLLDSFPTLSLYLNSDEMPVFSKVSAALPDPVRSFLSDDEYASLSDTEKNQLALDRYVNQRKKNEWQIGRDYEMSIGYQLESRGYVVTYRGIEEKLHDFGVDLIARRGSSLLVIQCKYWSSSSVIHEKYITQLYGSTAFFASKNPAMHVIPVFISSTFLSSDAKLIANKLSIKYFESVPMFDFPRIKCNIGRDENNCISYIYHLPMDPQYDSVKINKPGECMAFTVQEAESFGFRRAFHWH